MAFLCPQCENPTVARRSHQNGAGYVRNRECRECGYRFATIDGGDGEKFVGPIEAAVNKFAEIDRAEFERMYLDKNVSIDDITTFFGIHYTTVRAWRKKLDLPKRNREYKNGRGHRHDGRQIDVYAAARLIFDEGKRLSTVAILLQVNQNRLSKALQAAGYCVSIRRDCRPSLCEFYYQCISERWALQLKPLPCYMPGTYDEGTPDSIEADSLHSKNWR